MWDLYHDGTADLGNNVQSPRGILFPQKKKDGDGRMNLAPTVAPPTAPSIDLLRAEASLPEEVKRREAVETKTAEDVHHWRTPLQEERRRAEYKKEDGKSSREAHTF